MSRPRRHLRHWAASMLMLWLFGIGCGVAQACMLAHLQAAPPAIELTAAGTLDSCEHQHEDDGGLAQAQCRDFCDKASTSIPTLKSTLSGLLLAALMPTVVNTVAPAPALVIAAEGWPRPPDRPAAPITITYGRLAL